MSRLQKLIEPIAPNTFHREELQTAKLMGESSVDAVGLDRYKSGSSDNELTQQ